MMSTVGTSREEAEQATSPSDETSDESGASRGGRITYANKQMGERIRFARKWAGLNQDEVATRMGLSRASISNWELGQGIKRRNLVSFAQVAGVSAGWLMTGEDGLSPKSKEERNQNAAPASEIDIAQLERLTAAAFELLGKPPSQAQELARAILKAALYSPGAQEAHDEALTKRLAQVLIRMYAP
jgi:transcriptional regulator with XRE-family HTH domain